MQAPPQRVELLSRRETQEYAVTDALVGATLMGAYRVDRRVAEGGMGVVYAGEQLRLGRTVAIKVLREPLTKNSEALARFKLEAELIARLGHPHIVQIIDIGATPDGTPFIVMEYLHGETLLDRLMRDGSVPLPACARIVERLASALSATHRAGVVHRDIKPENVFLVKTPSDADFVKLLDFGIGKIVASGKSRITEDAVALGTPEYMAPEQATARSSVDHRADQYSLAAVTFAMLTGRPPFAAAAPQDVIAQLLSDEVPPPSRYKPGIPAALDAAILRALRKKPEERFASVQEFQRAVDRAAHGQRSQPPATPTRSPVSQRAPESRRTAERKTKTAPSGRSTGSTAKGHLEAARAAAQKGELDAAVEHAEALLELGAVDRDPVALDLLRLWLPTLDRIFRERVGSLNRRVAPGALARKGPLPNISSKAQSLIDAAAEGSPQIKDLLTSSGSAEREGIWLLAGLLRRKYLVLL